MIYVSTPYLTGGTTTVVTDKWQGILQQKMAEPFGHWNTLKLQGANTIHIIMAYAPVHTTGPLTSWTQQWHQLHEHFHIPNCLITAFWQNLTNYILMIETPIILILDATTNDFK